MNFEDTIDELYSCLPRDRNKFNSIMEDMKRRFLRSVKKPNKRNRLTPYNNSFQPIKNQYYFNNNQVNLTYNHKNETATNILNFKLSSPYQINNYKENNFPVKNNHSRNTNYKPVQVQEKSNHYNTQRDFYQEKNRENKFLNNQNKNVSNGFQGTLPGALLIKSKPLRTDSQRKLLSDTHANCNFYYPEKSNENSDREENGWHNQANNIMFNTNENFFIGNK